MGLINDRKERMGRQEERKDLQFLFLFVPKHTKEIINHKSGKDRKGQRVTEASAGTAQGVSGSAVCQLRG